MELGAASAVSEKWGQSKDFAWVVFHCKVHSKQHVKHLAVLSYGLMIDWEILKEGNEHKT